MTFIIISLLNCKFHFIWETTQMFKWNIFCKIGNSLHMLSMAESYSIYISLGQLQQNEGYFFFVSETIKWVFVLTDDSQVVTCNWLLVDDLICILNTFVDKKLRRFVIGN